MAIALVILVLLAAAAFGVWVMARLATLIRELTKVTTGLGVQIGRITESARQGEVAPRGRGFGSG